MASFWRFLTILLIIGSRSALYVGLGFLCYAYFVQDHIDWSSAWFYAYLLVWPLILFAKFFLWAVVAAVVITGLVFAGLWANEQWDKRRFKRAMERRKAESQRRRGIIEH